MDKKLTSLIAELRSRVGHFEIQWPFYGQKDSIEIVHARFHDRRVVISIAGKAEDRYDVQYDKLVRDGRGSWKTERQTARDILFAGTLWIVQQVFSEGKVKPEIVD